MVRHRKEIIAALKIGGDERRRVFKYWEEEYGFKFSRGAKGYKLYCELIEFAKKAGDEKATEEFRQRFLPLCDKEVVAAELLKAKTPERAKVEEEQPKIGFVRRLFGR
jgi:hypothetical protein